MPEKLTNEDLSTICNDNFELALFAIELGRYFIQSGRETHLRDILDEIRRYPNKNHILDLKESDRIEAEEQQEFAEDLSE